MQLQLVVTMRRLPVLALMFAVAASAVLAANSPDGQPRPPWFPQTPTRAYGPTPDCVDPATGMKVDCEWYGFAHLLHPGPGADCLIVMRELLSNTSLIGYIRPYRYYFLKAFVLNTATNESVCSYGCFNMGSSSDTPPTPGFAPPPELFAPPPPGRLSAPPTMAPTDPTTTPPNAGTVPPSALPAPPRSGIFNLNAAAFVRPGSGILSLVVSGALFVLNFFSLLD